MRISIGKKNSWGIETLDFVYGLGYQQDQEILVTFWILGFRAGFRAKTN